MSETDGQGHAAREAAETRAEETLGRILDASHRLHPDDLAQLVADEGPQLGLRNARIYVIDYDQRALVLLPRRGPDAAEHLPVDDEWAGRAFRTQQPCWVQSPGGYEVCVPLLDGAERLGVLAAATSDVEQSTLRRCGWLGTLAAELLISKSAFGDLLQQARRRREMDLAAELRWALLPPLTFTTDRVAISGILEPAYEIAGDSFDYGVNGGIAHLAILDAMGHGLEASRIVNLAIAAYRHSRRREVDLAETFAAIDRVIDDQFGGERFVTGQLGRLDLSTGKLTWLNAGHPRPLLLRGDGSLEELACEPCLPFGLGDRQGETAQAELHPADSLLFHTDGVTEARAPDGTPFGVGRLAARLRSLAASEIPAEIMRRLCHEVVDFAGGHLADDATLLLVRLGGDGVDPTLPLTF